MRYQHELEKDIIVHLDSNRNNNPGVPRNKQIHIQHLWWTLRRRLIQLLQLEIWKYILSKDRKRLSSSSHPWSESLQSSMEWDKVIDTLSREHTVYTIDLLGCGKSDKPAITYTCYLYVQLLTDFIRDIIGEKTDIVATGASVFFCNSCLSEHCRSDWSYNPCLSGKHPYTCKSTKP